MTDSRILKIMARIPIHSMAGGVPNAAGCSKCAHDRVECKCVTSTGSVQLVTMDEVRKAMERFQQEMVFNMPTLTDTAHALGAYESLRMTIIGDSQLEARHG